CLPERSARRSATVTNSVPLAMRASRINSFDANFPVPTSRRDANSRSAIFSFEGLSATEKDNRIGEHTRMPASGEHRLPACRRRELADDFQDHAITAASELQKLFGRLPKKGRLAACAPQKRNVPSIIFDLYELRS